jgi:outer membrane lipoprotein-sorting protein
VNGTNLASIATLAVLIALSGSSRAETARELLDQAKAVNEAREPKDLRQRMKMLLVDSRGTPRTREIEVFSKNGAEDETKSITFFLSPADVKGVGFLAWAHHDREDDQWLYLPALKRVRRITSTARRQSFQGSDFSYADLELFDEIPDWTEEDAAATLVSPHQDVDGTDTATIELVPRGKDVEYARIVVWLARGDSTLRRIELYDADRSLVKRLKLADFRTVAGIPTPHRLEMVNEKKGTRTILELSGVTYNQGLGDDVFTERSLVRGRVD